METEQLKRTKIANKRQFVSILLTVTVISLCCLVFAYDSPTNPFFIIGQYLYAPIEAPFCLSKIGKRIGIAASYSAIDEYLRKNLHSDMDKVEVRKVFEQISPVDVDEYDNFKGEHFAEVVMLMCDEPLNNPVYTVEYSSDGKFISIEQEYFP